MADKNFLTDIIDADLAEGKVQQIHTRFPPEPNGYLHIGSAKAIYINWSIANQYGGKFNLRLDDTNPAREGEEYVNSIIEDLHWLGADPNGGIFYGSDYFDERHEYAEKLITEGKAYCGRPDPRGNARVPRLRCRQALPPLSVARPQPGGEPGPVPPDACR